MGLIKNIEKVRTSSFVDPSGIITLPCIDKINQEDTRGRSFALCHSPFDKNFEMNCTEYSKKYGIVNDDSLVDKLIMFELLYVPITHPYYQRITEDIKKTSPINYLEIYNNNKKFKLFDKKLYAFVNAIFYKLPIMQQFEEEFKVLNDTSIKADERRLDLLLFGKSFFDCYLKELNISIDPSKDYLNLLNPNADFYKTQSYHCASFPYFQGEKVSHSKGLLKDSRIHPLQFRKIANVLKALNMSRNDFNDKDYTDLVFFLSRVYEYSPVLFNNTNLNLLDKRYISEWEYEDHHRSYRHMTHKTLILLYVHKADEKGHPFREFYFRLREAFLRGDRVRSVGETICHHVIDGERDRNRFGQWLFWSMAKIHERIQKLPDGSNYMNKYSRACVFDLLANPKILND